MLSSMIPFPVRPSSTPAWTGPCPTALPAPRPAVQPLRAGDNPDEEDEDDLVDDEPLAPDQPLADEDSAFEDFDDEFDDDFEEDEHDPDWDHPDEGDAPPPPPPAKGPGRKK
ncbi:MAG: hypothetical protein FJ309_11710 [Planctomycetes bacterium]|nr:hypothetical protein [Planctomycetota bacterium]